MKLLIFNGAPDNTSGSISNHIVTFFTEYLKSKNIEVTVYTLAENTIPLLKVPFKEVPESVKSMIDIFTQSHAQIWLSPLYHGGIPGSVKNCLDWLELSSKNPKPYLSGQAIGMICWADGVQAMQGINNMDAIAKALRAWVLPYAVPITRKELFSENVLNPIYVSRFKIMGDLISDNIHKFNK